MYKIGDIVDGKTIVDIIIEEEGTKTTTIYHNGFRDVNIKCKGEPLEPGEATSQITIQRFPLNKKIICSLCGNTFSAHSQKEKRYYRCQGYTRKKICPGKAKIINADKSEIIIKNIILNHIEKLHKKGKKIGTDIKDVFNQQTIFYLSNTLTQITSSTFNLRKNIKDEDKTIEEKINEYKDYSNKMTNLLKFDMEKHLRMLENSYEEECKRSKWCKPIIVSAMYVNEVEYFENMNLKDLFDTCIKEIYYDLENKSGHIALSIDNFETDFKIN